jgi:hypothetical protein
VRKTHEWTCGHNFPSLPLRALGPTNPDAAADVAKAGPPFSPDAALFAIFYSKAQFHRVGEKAY